MSSRGTKRRSSAHRASLFETTSSGLRSAGDRRARQGLAAVHLSSFGAPSARVGRSSPQFAAVRRSSPQFAAVRRSSPQFAAVRRSSPQFAAVRRSARRRRPVPGDDNDLCRSPPCLTAREGRTSPGGLLRAITDEQLRLLPPTMTEQMTKEAAAAAAGMSEPKARDWKSGALPSARASLSLSGPEVVHAP